MTPARLAVLMAVADAVLARGYGPTLRELQVILGHRAKSSAQPHLAALSKQGLLEPRRAQHLPPPITEAGWRLLARHRPSRYGWHLCQRNPVGFVPVQFDHDAGIYVPRALDIREDFDSARGGGSQPGALVLIKPWEDRPDE